MDVATFLGVIVGVSLIFFGISTGAASAQEVTVFFWGSVAVASAFITYGGTLAATLINWPLSYVLQTVNIVRQAFFYKPTDPKTFIPYFIEYARIVRREGVLALENVIDEAPHPFLKRGLRAIVDGLEPDVVERIMDTEIERLAERHDQGAKILVTMYSVSPAFGMLGTLIGLIQMLFHLDDPSKIGPGMAKALLTTFYGALAAYFLFLPMEGKLRLRSDHELLVMALIRDGVVSLAKGESHIVVEEKLAGYITPKERAKVRQMIEARYRR